MENEILYFGYGANRDANMLKAIIGRKPSGFPVKLEGFELCVQTWEEIPQNVRRNLEKSWNPDFRTFCIRSAKGA